MIYRHRQIIHELYKFRACIKNIKSLKTAHIWSGNVRAMWNHVFNSVFIEDKNKAKSLVTSCSDTFNFQVLLFIPNFRSIFNKNWAISSLFNASSIEVKLYSSCKSAMSGQSNRMWCNDWIPVLHEQWRSSRGMNGLHRRPVSIRRLWEPHLYLDVRILSTSRMLFLCLGGVSSGLTSRYTPHRDSSSCPAFLRILSSHPLRYLSISCFWHSSGDSNSRWRLS